MPTHTAFQFVTEKELEQIKTPVTVNTKLKSIYLMHFGWNIDNQFKFSISCLETIFEYTPDKQKQNKQVINLLKRWRK